MLLSKTTYRLGKLASFIWFVHNFVIEDREVESKTKSDGMSWGKRLTFFCGFFISLFSLIYKHNIQKEIPGLLGNSTSPPLCTIH